MKTKICPCCDQPIQGIYCKGCRKIVWSPVEREVNYYLNTRHPAFDHDCTFHDDMSRKQSTKAALVSDTSLAKADDRMSFSAIEAKKEEIRKRMMQNRQERVYPAGNPKAAKPSGNSKAGNPISKKKSGLRMLILIFLLWFVLSFAGIFFTMFSWFL